MMCGPTVRAALSFSPLASVGGKPHPSLPQRGRSATQTPSNTASRDSRPLGGPGRGFGLLGRGLPQQLFLFRRTAGSFTANGGFLILLLFSLPMGRRGGGCWQISESGLSGISATTRRRIGRSPEKEQNFLDYSRVLPGYPGNSNAPLPAPPNE